MCDENILSVSANLKFFKIIKLFKIKLTIVILMSVLNTIKKLNFYSQNKENESRTAWTLYLPYIT